jgi:hypothetical protein
MSPELHVILLTAVTHGIPVALGIRELVLLRRWRAARGGDGEPMRRPQPLPPDDAPELPPLPPCLIPRGEDPDRQRAARRERALEPA